MDASPEYISDIHQLLLWPNWSIFSINSPSCHSPGETCACNYQGDKRVRASKEPVRSSHAHLNAPEPIYNMSSVLFWTDLIHAPLGTIGKSTGSLVQFVRSLHPRQTHAIHGGKWVAVMVSTNQNTAGWRYEPYARSSAFNAVQHKPRKRPSAD